MNLAATTGGVQLTPGFADPVHDAQRAFRGILDAIAHPGRVIELPDVLAPPPTSFTMASAVVLLTLCDTVTPVWLADASADAAAYIAFHCGSPAAAELADAGFAFFADATGVPPLDAFALGTDEYPERSATIVIEVAALAEGSGVVLSGPGIRDTTRLWAAGLPESFWAERAVLERLFPRGIEVLFTCGRRLAALPRSTHVAP